MPTDRFNDDVRPLIERSVTAYLQEHPSQRELDEGQLLPIHRQLAAMEQERGPLLPLYPDNSLHFVHTDQRIDVLGSRDTAKFIDNFYVASGEHTFAMLEYIRSGHNPLTLGLDLMFATAATMARSIIDGFISYRSHADGFIIGCEDPARVRQIFERAYQLQSTALPEHLRRLLNAVETRSPEFPFVLEWIALLQTYQLFARPLIQMGERFQPQVASHVAPAGQSPVSQHTNDRLQHSPFHDYLQRNPQYRQLLDADEQFQLYRVSLNLLYLQLTRLGIRPVDRYMLCHLAANTVEAVFDVNAVEIVSRFSKFETADWNKGSDEGLS
jgi:hypothetical protein